jgi:hypothetical protein
MPWPFREVVALDFEFSALRVSASARFALLLMSW